MRLGRSLSATTFLILGIVVVGTPESVSATSYVCSPVPERILDAEAVIVGRTISQDKKETRPGITTYTYHFKIDEVLKGTRYKAGDIITETATVGGWPVGGTHFPPSYWGAYVVFMNKGDDSIVRSDPCKIAVESEDPAYRADIPGIRRMVTVTASPEKYLESTDATEVKVILTWISRSYFGPWWSRIGKDNSGVELALDRQTVISYLVKHAGDETGPQPSPRPTHPASALEILGRFCEEEHYDLLKSRADQGHAGAQQGVSCIEAGRRIPGLFERLRELRRERAAAIAPVPLADREAIPWPDNEYANTIAELVETLRTAGDREAAKEFTKELQAVCTGSSDAGVQLGDEAALASILGPAWDPRRRALTTSRIFDPEAVREARENIYDDRRAVTLLAQKGDRQVAEFMIRLIRQGHGDGGTWAATVQDRSLIPDLLRALEHAHSAQSWNVALALGRLRAWEAIKLLKRTDGIRRRAIQTMFLVGTIDAPQYWSEQFEWSRAPKRLRELADAEGWPENIYETLVQLAHEVEPGTFPGGEWPYNMLDASIAWVPPAGLPDMPDPLAKDESWQFLSGNEERVAAVLRTGSAADKCKVLHAAALAKAWIDHDALAALIRDDSSHVRNLTWHYMRALSAELDKESVRRWALEGSPEITTQALRYITEKADNSHAPIVETLFRRGWHLFDPQLFRAIIATKAHGCIYDWPGKGPGLRSYVNGHHIALRQWAAVALASLGDDTGKELLNPLLGRSTIGAYQPNSKDVSHALSVIDPDGFWGEHEPPTTWPQRWLRKNAVAIGVTFLLLALAWRAERHGSQQRRAETVG